VTVALVIPPLVSWPSWQGDPAFAALLSVTLVPQALPLSIPAALGVAVLWAMRGKTVTWRRTGTVLAVSLGFSVAVWVVLEWMMPQSNQAFREMVAARLSDGRVVALEPGLNELGLSRLAQRSDPAAVRQYQLLWALCFASAPLGLLALGLARYIRRAVSAVLLAIALSNAYFAILWACTAVAARSAVPSSVPAWTPNALFLLVGCALLVPALRPQAALTDSHGP
jgi:lipopolysaccharide export LptBFGC system permease protein LptF